MGLLYLLYILLTDPEDGGTMILRNFNSYCQSTRRILAQCIPTLAPIFSHVKAHICITPWAQNPF